MAIGYACIIENEAKLSFKSYTLKTMSEEKIEMIISNNLKVLKGMLEYNVKNDIKLFRISSDIIPLASHESFNYDWQNKFKKELEDIGEYAIENNIRLSMHPGQYTIINSNKEEVVFKAIRDLDYHAAFLDSLKLDTTHKIILHIGGVYNDKPSAIKRFISVYKTLDKSIKQRLVIENDDKFYNIDDVYYIYQQTNCPIVFDNLHHTLNHLSPYVDEIKWIEKCSQTWLVRDGRQKVHYAQQDPNKRKGAHSKTIRTSDFIRYFNDTISSNIDIMLEVKDKNISAIKCNNLVNKDISFNEIEKEWARYKYLVLEKSQHSYLAIRSLLKNRDTTIIYEFYEIIDNALLSNDSMQSINAYEHVWGYFKKNATSKEKDKFFSLLSQHRVDGNNTIKIKKHLYRLALKYDEKYLLESYFFLIY